MQQPYHYEILDLDTPDDDPRWAAYQDVLRFSLLSPRAGAESVDLFRAARRADGSVLGMVTAEGPGLAERTPVAAFSAASNTVNTGGRLTGVLVINTIGVLPSHRRRGLLKAMMARQLDRAREAGLPLATLTASEATIYGRFGFAPANDGCETAIDTRRFAFSETTPMPGGRVEFVAPAFLAPHWQSLVEAHQLAHRGAVGHAYVHRVIDTGAWDEDAAGPSRKLRAAVHFDEDGTPDGFATFEHRGWEIKPYTVVVHKVCAARRDVEWALWRALAEMDLVERLTYELAPAGDPMRLALRDPRAIDVKASGDWAWLRILDLPAAVAGRGFEADGEVSLEVSDPMGYCSGAWTIRADGGRGSCAPSDKPEVRLGAAELAAIWHGGTSAVSLAAAGRVTGPDVAVARLDRLFRTAVAPVCLASF